MTFPDFYNPARVGELYTPDVRSAVEAAAQQDITPASHDNEQILLLLVDAQVDFIHPDGALSVPGAVKDTQRTIEWLFNNLSRVTKIAASLDSHVPIQIFSPTWWMDSNGQPPAPYTVITADQVAAGEWVPQYDAEWSTTYVRQLEDQARKQLMIWPYHTLIGTPGHNIMPALYEAIAYHAAARQTQPHLVTKGTIPKTEHYSMLEPEVKVPELPGGTLNMDFLDMIGSYDRVYIAGQAKSHCVLETTTSMMRAWGDRPDLIDKLYLLEDTTSSVAHPEIDFEAMAQQTYADFAAQGLHVTTTDAN